MLVLILIIIGFAALGWASLTWGADSREPYRDDHAR